MANIVGTNPSGVVIHRTVNTTAQTLGESGPAIPTSGQIWPPVYRQAEG